MSVNGSGTGDSNGHSFNIGPTVRAHGDNEGDDRAIFDSAFSVDGGHRPSDDTSVSNDNAVECDDTTSTDRVMATSMPS